MLPPLTLGVEEEYQIVNAETQDLADSIDIFLNEASATNAVGIKPEFMQSQVEVGSNVCANIQEIRAEVIRLRRAVISIAESQGVQIAAASTHPFATWQNQTISDGIRYQEMVDDMAGVGRRLVIFGMHVHVGFGHNENPENADLMIEIMNQARYFVPHMLALSTSSPFWHGSNTGLKSYRSVVFEHLPRTGIPYTFDSYGEYRAFARTLERTGAFGKHDKTAKIWWDIRPHPIFDTLEFRISDVCTKVDETVCLVALYQAVCAKLLKLRRQNMAWRSYRHMHITENKWRALRYGVQGNLIDFGLEQERPFPKLIEDILELIDDVVDELGSRKEIEYVRTILEEGTSADRQLNVYQNHGGDANQAEALRAVVNHVVAETKLGVF